MTPEQRERVERWASLWERDAQNLFSNGFDKRGAEFDADAAALRAVLAEADEAAKLRAFAVALVREWDWSNHIDGGDFQEIAVKHGVLVPTPVTEPCGENCSCEEYGDFPQECYRLARSLRQEGKG